MSDVSKLMDRLAADEAPETARKIFNALKADKALTMKIVTGPNPLRAMIFESGVIEDPAAIDGNTYYHAIVAELEKLIK